MPSSRRPQPQGCGCSGILALLGASLVVIALACGGLLLVGTLGNKGDRKGETEPENTQQVRQEEQKKGKISAELLEIRIEPFRTAAGMDTVMICSDWKNTGDRPIRRVDAKIQGYDQQGNLVEIMAVPDYTIYAVFNDEPGVAPGETHRTQRGFIVPPLLGKRLARATAQITKVDDVGIPDE